MRGIQTQYWKVINGSTPLVISIAASGVAIALHLLNFLVNPSC